MPLTKEQLEKAPRQVNDDMPGYDQDDIGRVRGCYGVDDAS